MTAQELKEIVIEDWGKNSDQYKVLSHVLKKELFSAGPEFVTAEHIKKLCPEISESDLISILFYLSSERCPLLQMKFAKVNQNIYKFLDVQQVKKALRQKSTELDEICILYERLA
jgi:hypothetical protein